MLEIVTMVVVILVNTTLRVNSMLFTHGVVEDMVKMLGAGNNGQQNGDRR